MKINALTAEIAGGRRDPYETSHEVAGMANQTILDDATCSSLWLAWSILADGYEVGGWTIERTNEEMRRFASEWLEVAGDATKHRPFLDRWLHDELGYPRDAPERNKERQEELEARLAVVQDYRECECETLTTVPRPEDSRNPEAAVSGYTDHMVWLDDQAGSRVFRCRKTGALWAVKRSAMRQMGGEDRRGLETSL